MIKALLSPKIILPVACVLLFFGMGDTVNRYQVSHLLWLRDISNLSFASIEFNGSFFSVLGEVEVNYDGISKSAAELSDSGKPFIERQLTEQAIVQNSPNYIASAYQLDMPYSLDVTQQLISDRLQNAEDFKTHNSIARNSKMIAIQMAKELRLNHSESPRDVLRYSNLLVSTLNFVRLQSKEEKAATIALVARLASDEKAKTHSNAYQNLKLLARHLNLIEKHQSLVETSAALEGVMKETLNGELLRSRQYLMEVYAAEARRSGSSRMLFLLLTAMTIIYGGALAIRNIKLAARLKNSNEQLERGVVSRTKDLLQETEFLRQEKIKGESLIFQLERSERKLDTLVNSVSGCIVEFSVATGVIGYVSRGVEELWGKDRNSFKYIADMRQQIHPDDEGFVDRMGAEIFATSEPAAAVYRVIRPDDSIVWVRHISTPVLIGKELDAMVCVIIDISEAKKARRETEQVQQELVHAQKMESVGMLAAGIAHEINTPAQFVSDNLAFLGESWADVTSLIQSLRNAVEQSGNADTIEAASQACEKADLEYLLEECQPALKQSSDGIAAIAKIVRAMKEYSHPSDSIEMVDINRSIENTIMVSKSEWKEHAVLETNLEEGLPLVECVGGEINQVVLNMIVNAAHALEGRNNVSTSLHGKITISTESTDDNVFIRIQDNGSGMTEEVKSKVFEHFFTTKEVGRGTGQGLTLAHRIVVENHGGSIAVESELGTGTTFIVRIPRACELAATA